MKHALAPIDYYFYRHKLYTMQFVFEYPGVLNEIHFRNSLSRTLEKLPLLNSRLESDGNQRLVLASTKNPISLRSQTLFNRYTNLSELIDPVTNTPQTDLLKIVLSHFENTTFVGLSFSHILGDGFSFLTFLRSLGATDLPKLSFDREALGKDLPALLVDPLENIFELTGYSYQKDFVVLPSSTLKTLHISHKELSDLRKNAPFALTSNDLIMGILLKKVHHNIPRFQNKIVVRCPVDYRNRYSKIDHSYFGNAVRDAVTIFNDENFEKLSVYEIAHSIQKSVANVNEEKIKNSLATLEQIRKEQGLHIFEKITCPGLLVTNLSKLPFHQIDMGLGAPLKVHQASSWPGLAVIWASKDGFDITFDSFPS